RRGEPHDVPRRRRAERPAARRRGAARHGRVLDRARAALDAHEARRLMLLWLRQVLALAIKELQTTLKDRRSRFVVIAPPILQFFVFGYAATFDVHDVAWCAVDEDRSPESRDLLRRL